MKEFYHNTLFTLSLFSIITSSLLSFLFLLGYRPFIIKSSSMEPLYHKYDLVMVDTTINADNTKTGEVYVYRTNSGMLVMHRLINHNTFKGDANNKTQQVNLTNVNLVGQVKYSFTIPCLNSLVKNKEKARILSFFLLLLSCKPKNTLKHNINTDNN